MDITQSTKISFAVISVVVAAAWAAYGEASKFTQRVVNLETHIAVNAVKNLDVAQDVADLTRDVKALQNGQQDIIRKQDVQIALLEDLRNGKTKIR